jgi:hypothetical protein
LLERLRNLNIDRIDIDDAIELVTFGRVAETTYSGYQVPTPAWLKDSITALDGEIKSRRRDMLLARQKEIAARLSALKTRDEKKAELEAEQAKLNDALGTAP